MSRMLRGSLALCGVLALAGAPLAAQTSLTIYNDGRVLVRRSERVAVPKGPSAHRLVVGPIDAASLFSLDPAVAITEARYDGAVDEQSILRRLIGQKFTFWTGSVVDPINGTLLGVNPERWRMDDGSIVFNRPGRIRFTGEMVGGDPTLELRVAAAQARPALGLGYFTRGAMWQASYQLTLAGASVRVEGTVAVSAQTLRADSAEVQLLAGNVGNAGYSPMRQQVLMAEDARAAAVPMAKAMPIEQTVGETHLYSLPGRWTLLPGTTSLLPLFDPVSAPVTRTLVVRGQGPRYGLDQESNEKESVPVDVTYVVSRPRASAFGDKALPGGIARVFAADKEGRVQLVGEAAIGHTPAGKDLDLHAGTAFDITAQRRQTDYTTARDSGKTGVRTRGNAAYEVTVANASDSAVTVDVREERMGEWRVVSSTVPAEKLSSSVSRFRVRVPPRGEAVLTYRLEVIW